MEYKLEANGIHFVCRSPTWTQRMIEWGARLVEPRQAEDLSKALATGNVGDEPVSRNS
jgi:hypothetical protein